MTLTRVTFITAVRIPGRGGTRSHTSAHGVSVTPDTVEALDVRADGSIEMRSGDACVVVPPHLVKHLEYSLGAAEDSDGNERRPSPQAGSGRRASSKA